MYTVAQMMAEGYSIGPPSLEVEEIDAQIAERYPCPKCSGPMRYEAFGSEVGFSAAS